jgi:hypothetical protein
MKNGVPGERGTWNWRGSCPDQKASVFIDCESLGADEFFFEIFHILVIQGKPPL